MEERTAVCRPCGATFTCNALGRKPERCENCLTPKLRAQRAQRAQRTGADRAPAKCAGPCGRPLHGYREAPGLDAFCKECGPGPGVTRRALCRGCGDDVWRAHKGGGQVAARPGLCKACERTLKWCYGCHRARAHQEFSLSREKTSGRVSRCKDCESDRYRAADRIARVARRFGLSREEWMAIFQRQDGRCAICRGEQKDLPRGYLYVDHDHRCCPTDSSCGQCVRGLLCVRCNWGIGQLDDDAARLRAAADYLDHFVTT